MVVGGGAEGEGAWRWGRMTLHYNVLVYRKSFISLFTCNWKVDCLRYFSYFTILSRSLSLFKPLIIC